MVFKTPEIFAAHAGWGAVTDCGFSCFSSKSPNGRCKSGSRGWPCGSRVGSASERPSVSGGDRSCVCRPLRPFRYRLSGLRRAAGHIPDARAAGPSNREVDRATYDLPAEAVSLVQAGGRSDVTDEIAEELAALPFQKRLGLWRQIRYGKPFDESLRPRGPDGRWIDAAHQGDEAGSGGRAKSPRYHAPPESELWNKPDVQVTKVEKTFRGSFDLAWRWGKRYLRGKPIVNRDTGMSIQIGRQGLKKAIHSAGHDPAGISLHLDLSTRTRRSAGKVDPS